MIRPSDRDRRKDGRARPDDNVDFSTADTMPLIVTLAVGQAAMLNGDTIAERRTEYGRDGGRQRYLGHEHQHAAPFAALSASRR